MLSDKSLKNRFKCYGIYALVSLLIVLICQLTDILNIPAILHISKNHETVANYWTFQESFTNLYSITHLFIWIVLIIYVLKFIWFNVKEKQWKALLILPCVLILLYPLPTLTSPKYLIPGIIFLPFLLARIILNIKGSLTQFKFRIVLLTFIVFSLLIQLISLEPISAFPYLQITHEPQLHLNHDGYRVFGAYLQGYNEVKKAQIKSFHPPIYFSRKLAQTIASIPEDVTVTALKDEDNTTNEVWIWQFTTLYLQLKGYQVQQYDRDSTITLTKNDKTVQLMKLEADSYNNYQFPQGYLIKLPYVSRQDQNAFTKVFEQFYQSLDHLKK